MRFNFGAWDIGGKSIFIAACLAIASLFFTWVDVGFYAENGFEQQAFLFLLCFIYPTIRLLQNKSLNRIGGYLCAIAGIICGIVYITSKSTEVFGIAIDAAGTGPYVFIVASVILGFGVFKYSKR